jgi:hypothetical protein
VGLVIGGAPSAAEILISELIVRRSGLIICNEPLRWLCSAFAYVFIAQTLRKEGCSSDPYVVFRNLLGLVGLMR